MTAKRVLVVEPDPVTASSLCQLCQRHGYAVTSIKEGKHAIAKTVEFKPTLIIVRAELEDVSGLSLCNRFRESTAFRHLPILVLTSSGHTETISKHMSGPSRANAYLALPVNPEKLLRQIESLLALPKEKKPSVLVSDEKTQIAKQASTSAKKAHGRRGQTSSRSLKTKAISSRQHQNLLAQSGKAEPTSAGAPESDPAETGREKTGKQEKDLPWGLDGKMEFLRENLRKKEQEISELTAQMEKNRALVEQWQQKLQTKEQDLAQLNRRKEELERELAQAYQDAEASSQQYQDSVQELRRDKAGVESELSRLVMEKERQVQEMRDEIAQIEHEKDLLIQELQGKIEESERQYALISDQMRSVLEEKDHERQQLTEVIDRQREENTTQEHTLQTLRHQLDERTQVESQLHTRLRQAEEMVSQLEAQMHKLAGDKDEVEAFLQGELTRVSERTHLLESELYTLKEDAHQQSQTYVEMIAERDHQIQHLDASLKRLTHEREESEVRWEHAYQEQTAELERVKDTNEKLQRSCLQFKEANEQQRLELQAKLTQLHDTVAMKQKALEEQRSRQEQQEAQLNKLRQRNRVWSQTSEDEKVELERKLQESEKEKTRIQQALQAAQHEQQRLQQLTQQLKTRRQDSKREEIRERFRQHIELITQRNKNELMSLAPNRDQSSDRTQKAPNPALQNIRKQLQSRAQGAVPPKAQPAPRMPLRDKTLTVLQEDRKPQRRPPAGSAPTAGSEESTREYTLESLDPVG